MTITTKTYFKNVGQVPAKQWPPLLREAHDLIIAHTDNGKDWSALKWDKGFKALCDATFEKWEAYFEKNQSSALEGITKLDKEVSYKEVKHVNQFLSINQTVVLKHTLDTFITELQKDIHSKEIGKHSAAAATISAMQEYAVRFYNGMKLSKYFELPAPLYKKLIRVVEDYDNQNQEDTPMVNAKIKAIPLQGVKEKKDTEKVTASVEITPKELKYVRQYLSFNKSVLLKSELEKFIDALQKDIKDQHIIKHSKAASAIIAMQDHAVNEYNKMRLSFVFEIPQPLLGKLNKVLDASITDTYTDRTRKVPLSGLEGTQKKNGLIKLSDTEFKIIKTYLSFDDKTLTKQNLGDFIDNLQDDIRLKRVTKKSDAAPLIDQLQKEAIRNYNKMDDHSYYVVSEELYPKLIKLYNYNQELNEKEKAKTLPDKEHLPLSGLSTPTDTTPTAENNTLTATVTPPSEKSETPAPAKVMNSVDFLNLSFKRLGFQPPWLNFIGDPSPGFTMMVYGRPKFGKSYLCLDFAGYLARHHGRVLYVAKEEKLDRTLQDKIVDKSVAHPNLVVADAIPEDLSSYEFIFLDSINKLGLSPQDLERLKTQNKGKSFVYIFQVNKAGAFKGSNTFQHDVDVVVELPEIGKAVQYGRFNQGGELNVFPEHKAEIQAEVNAAEPALYGTLEGIKKKTPTTEPAYPEWVTNKELSEQDRSTLKEIYNYYKKGDKVTAINLAMMGDTFLRELIPDVVWMRMGGKITRWSLPKHHLASVGIIYPDWVENSRDMDTRSALREFYDLYNDQQFELAQNVLEKNGKAFQKLIPKEFLAKKEESPKEQENTKRSAPTQTTDYADEFRALKQLHEENIGRKITDKAFNELMEQAIAKTPGFLKQAKELQENYMNYIRYMDRLSSE